MIKTLELLHLYYKKIDQLDETRIEPFIKIIGENLDGDGSRNILNLIKMAFWFCIAFCIACVVIWPAVYLPQFVVYPVYGLSTLIYRYKLDVNVFDLVEKHADDIKKWEKNNNIDVLHFYKFGNIGPGLLNSKLAFKRKSDMMAFKLTWSELCF